MRPATPGIRAPEFPPMPWLNSEPLRVADLAGRALLVEFWDYTSLHSLRTLPYVSRWHERYHDSGLVVAGVHTPEFPFAREEGHVARALARLGVAHPVALDNEFLAWQAFHNRYWPSRYLFDAGGTLRYYHYGEGDYRESELAIQECLGEVSPGRDWPAPLPPIHAEDRPGLVRLPATPELYLGLERGGPANPERAAVGETTDLALPARRDPDRVYIEGPWLAELRYLESAGPGPGALHLRYTAAEVHLILAPGGAEPVEVEVTVDGAVPAAAERGEPGRETASGAALVRVDEPRLYRLLRHDGSGTHELRLAVERPGLRAYAFTFVAGAAPAAGGPPPAPGPGASGR